MKKHFLLLAFFLTQSALAQITNCAADVVCFHEQLNRQKAEEKMRERQELRDYRQQQLLYEEVRLDEMQKQTQLLEEQKEVSQDQLESLKAKDRPKDQRIEAQEAAPEPAR